MGSKLLLILVVLLVLSVAVLWYFFSFKNITQQNYSKQLTLGSTQLKVETASSFAEQYKGLSGRESMCDKCGMLFVFDQARYRKFSMRGMKFPLDFIFIRDGEVVELVENVNPPQGLQMPSLINSREKADQVLEVNAGFIEKNNIKTGDEVKYD